LGTRAVQILLENISDPGVMRERHVILPTQLVIRETCASKRAQPDKVVNVKRTQTV
jgi:DNA-binding LacI/PurR family transcriptional regulator